mgnify:CR=1 FL=1
MYYDKAVKNRLKRIEGQFRGILKMMDEQQECQDVITQLSAVRKAVDRRLGLLVSMTLAQCVRKQVEEGQDTEELVKEAVDLLVKSR